MSGTNDLMPIIPRIQRTLPGGVPVSRGGIFTTVGILRLMHYYRAFTVREVAHLLRLSDRHVWSLIADETIRVVRFGRSVRIPESSLRILLEGEVEDDV